VASEESALLISEFKIKDNQLREHGSTFTEIRRIFEERANEYEKLIQLDDG
jgi:hypothetical protein